MNRQTHDMLNRLQSVGISSDDAFALRRIAMTLQRWHELECGDSDNYRSWAIERDGDEPNSKPYMVTHMHHGEGRTYRTAIPDRETGARKRLAAIMARYPDLVPYVQGDPRGASLFIVRVSDVAGRDISTCYSQGIAVYR